MDEKEIIEFFNKMIDSIDLEKNLLEMYKQQQRDYELYGECFVYADLIDSEK